MLQLCVFALVLQAAQVSSAAFGLFRKEETSQSVTEDNRVALLETEHEHDDAN